MPDFEPFRGIRYDAERFGTDLSDIAAPPYDVIDEDRLAHLRSVHEFNAVHLTLPEDNPPEDDASGDRYQRAAALLRAWLDDAVLVADDTPGFYLYRVGFSDEDGRPRQMTGVIGALELCSPGEGGVLPHERTMPKPKTDRLDLLSATRANLEPIWGLSLSTGLSALLEPDGPAVAGCTDTRGAQHRLYAVTAPARIEAIAGTIGSTSVVIADGHHRYETSLRYRDELRAVGELAGPHDWIMTLVVELTDDQLAVQPIHRLTRGLPPPDGLRGRLAEAFDVRPVGPNVPDVIAGVGQRMVAEHAMALVDAEGVALLVPHPDALEAALASEPVVVGEVDAARFEGLVTPVLEGCGAEVTYRHDRATVAELVRKGGADAAVLLRPVDVPTIRGVAELGERMPQKTTFFHPKPSTGLVFRSFDV